MCFIVEIFSNDCAVAHPELLKRGLKSMNQHSHRKCTYAFYTTYEKLHEANRGRPPRPTLLESATMTV